VLLGHREREGLELSLRDLVRNGALRSESRAERDVERLMPDSNRVGATGARTPGTAQRRGGA